MVGATLVCGGSGGAVVPEAVAVTPSPLSLAGNAEIVQDVTLPAACFGPVVLVRIFNTTSTQLGSFIAATGLAPNAAQNLNQDSSDHGGGGRGH
jgi:ribose/xylose/arabinose/galactoside ABC-type transport system permease subunit